MAAATTIGMLSSTSLHSGTRFLNNRSSISHLYCSSFLPNFLSPSAFSFNRHTHSIGRISSVIGTVASATGMSSPFKPEEARIPPAIPLPTPPISKASKQSCSLIFVHM
ncbi:Hypothetical predicted protein [Olea europaea subsp. europaea]|uniref:Uncharacterized protein n=1 Tax=Olea europaea subsp. europaea TaxID=158383 RepID=A0A8S0R6I8_OLEEU|nr:Hypothetical predicted protein [Olea europaea subsp. europaea]